MHLILYVLISSVPNMVTSMRDYSRDVHWIVSGGTDGEIHKDVKSHSNVSHGIWRKCNTLGGYEHCHPKTRWIGVW